MIHPSVDFVPPLSWNTVLVSTSHQTHEVCTRDGPGHLKCDPVTQNANWPMTQDNPVTQWPNVNLFDSPSQFEAFFKDTGDTAISGMHSLIFFYSLRVRSIASWLVDSH